MNESCKIRGVTAILVATIRTITNIGAVPRAINRVPIRITATQTIDRIMGRAAIVAVTKITNDMLREAAVAGIISQASKIMLRASSHITTLNSLNLRGTAICTRLIKLKTRIISEKIPIFMASNYNKSPTMLRRLIFKIKIPMTHSIQSTIQETSN